MSASLPGKFVWFEHVSPDAAQSRRFYEQLFGWGCQSLPTGDGSYEMITAADTPIGGWGSASDGARWISYLSVADVDRAHAKALAAGARSESDPVNYGDVGRGAAIVDPTGARVSLWRGSQGDPPDADQVPTGCWLWNELITHDPTAAVDFYAALVDYRPEAMDMGPMGTYHVLKTADRPRAGVMKSPDPQSQAMWLPYVKVDDCDATATRARELGATVVAPPMDIPDIGRFSVVVDPQGATIAFMKPVF